MKKHKGCAYLFQFSEQHRDVQTTAAIAALLALRFQQLSPAASDGKQVCLHADDKNK